MNIINCADVKDCYDGDKLSSSCSSRKILIE